MSTRRSGKKRRFRIAPSIAWMFVILLLPAGVCLWGLYGNLFHVHKIVLTGTRLVSRQRALTVLRARYLDHNLIGISSGDVKAALHVFPYIRTVRTDRDFPDTLRIAITEYEPAACLLTPDGWYVITARGYVIAALSAAKTKGTTGTAGTEGTTGTAGTASQANGNGAGSTSGAGSADAVGATSDAASTSNAGSASSVQTDDLAPALAAQLRAGPPQPMHPALPAVFTTASVRVGQIVGDAQARAAALIAGSLPADLRAAAAYARVNKAGNVRLVLRDGPLVDFGGGSRLKAKTLALKAVLASYARGHVTPTYIDVSVPDRPLATPKLSN